MKTLRVCLFTSLLAAGGFNVTAQPTSQRDSVLAVIQSARPNPARAALAGVTAEPPRYALTDAGAIRSLSAPPGMHFPSPGGTPEVAAREFVRRHATAFGVVSPAVNFRLKKRNDGGGRHSIRFAQSYAEVPVFGGEMVVQVNDSGGVEYLSGNFDRDTADLDQKHLTTVPTLAADQAAEIVRARYEPLAHGQQLSVTSPELNLFLPALLKVKGPKRLTWKMEIRSADGQAVAQCVFIDAHSGDLVQEISLIYHALNRQIYDATNTYAHPGGLVRTEGQPPVGINDVDLAYLYCGDYYNFFYTKFNRDGFDNAGGAFIVKVRYGVLGDPPIANNDGTRTQLSQGYVTDDILGHELTHAFTASESGLIGLNESGALNESISDVFGELLDLTNGRGNDDPTNRWWVGEEGPNGLPDARPMHNPPLKGLPDWVGSPLYYTGPEDGGGTHSNMGVNNKLCYLLTDGDTFRGFNVVGMGINNVAELYYEANANLLVSSSGWVDLAAALRQSAINLGWSLSQRVNLDAAMAAVGILIQDFYLDENSASFCPQTGHAACDGISGIGPAKSFPVAFSLMPTNITARLFVAGTAHTNRIARPVRIQSWSGNARITP